VLRRAGGNPLFLEETARALLRLWEEADARGAPLPDGVVETVVPESLRGIIQARIDTLDERARLTLQCGAVIGPQFTLGVLQLFEIIREGLLDRLYMLRGLQFLRSRPTAEDLEFIFYHGLTQEVAYQSLLDAHRRELHGLIGRQLERKFGEVGTLEVNAAVLAFHYLRSDLRDKALEWTVASARHAAHLFANDEAIDLYEQALKVAKEDLPPTDANRRTLADVLRARGRLLRLTGRLDEADESFEALMSVAQSVDDAGLVADALAETGMNLYQRGRYVESDDALQRAAATYAQINDSPGVAMAFNSIGMNALARGELDAAVGWFDRAAEEDIEAERPAIAADIYNNRGLVLWHQRQYAKALENIRRAQGIWQRLHNRFGLCATTLNVGLLEEELGHAQQALEHYHHALEHARKLFYREAEAIILVNIGNALRRVGNLLAATEANQRAVELAEHLARKDIAATATENLGLDALAAGRAEHALEHFVRGLEIVGLAGPTGPTRLGNPTDLAPAPERAASLLLGRARALVALGQPTEARESCAQAAQILDRTPMAALDAMRAMVEGLVASASGDSAGAVACFQRAADVAQRAANPWDELEALLAWLGHCERVGDAGGARQIQSQVHRLRERLQISHPRKSEGEPLME
ncbi:MAG: tetratricopeptide repeat protein, partial [Candidatus Sumerlaeia bacterium]|nr:tetratricopeptide repeat protein [Candidatus Sumerlaeia bacterium]